MKQHCTLGVDVGGTHIRLGLLNAAGELSHLEKVPRAEALPDEKPEALADFLRDYLRRHGDCAAGVGIGIPGTLSRDCRSILRVPNIPVMDGMAISDLLEQALELPVFPENDTVMLMQGDLQRLGLPSRGVLLGVYIGTGLGSALYYDAKPLKGRNSLNEIGHLPLFGSKLRCSCGNIGCAENIISGRHLQDLRREKWPDTHISHIFAAMAGSEELQEFIDAIGVVLGGAVNLLDPEALVLGGGVTAMKDFPRRAVEEAIRERAMKPEPAGSLHILWSQGADDTGVLGAAVFAAQRL